MRKIYAIVSAFLLTGCTAAVMHSPSGTISAEFLKDKDGALAFTVSFNGRTVCDTSSIGVEADGIKTYEKARLRLISIRHNSN